MKNKFNISHSALTPTLYSSFSVLILILFLLSGCSDNKPILISCTKEYVSSAWENENDYFDNHDEFITDYFSITQKEDTTIITTLMYEHCSDSAVGIIDCTDKTIYLKLENMYAAEQYCPEFYKYTYVIYNPGNQEYDVVSVK